jgi:hypothetical protein
MCGLLVPRPNLNAEREGRIICTPANLLGIVVSRLLGGAMPADNAQNLGKSAFEERNETPKILKIYYSAR